MPLRLSPTRASRLPPSGRRLPRLLPVLAAACAAGALLSGCDRSGHAAAYRFAAWRPDGPGLPLLYEAALEGRAEGLPDARPYESRVRARLRYRPEADTAAGRIVLALGADSLGFSASDRDPAEARYMEERLRRYKARLVISTAGRVLALEEEPEPPPVDFSPLNLGRFLAFGMPAFPATPVRTGSEWQAEQPLLDKFHPASRVVKRYRVTEVREAGTDRFLVCSVDLEAWLEEGLGQGANGAAGDSARPALTGRGEAVFDLVRGIPVSSRLDLEGRFVSPAREAGRDSGQTEARPIRLALRLDLRFGP